MLLRLRDYFQSNLLVTRFVFWLSSIIEDQVRPIYFQLLRRHPRGESLGDANSVAHGNQKEEEESEFGREGTFSAQNSEEHPHPE
jgi:hypothetical protein